MDEETTTPEPVETGAEIAQPVETESTAAVETPTESTEEQTSEPAEGASDEDAELSAWASKKGLELDSDNTRKAAKMAREAEKDFHAKRQQSSELEKAAAAISDEDAASTAQATGQDAALLQRVQRVEIRENVRDFWNQPDIDKAYEPAMIELLKTKPYLAGDLESLYATAVMKSGGVAAVKSQGGRDALTKLAQNQQAAVPRGNATSAGQPQKKEFKDLSLAEMEKKLGTFRR